MAYHVPFLETNSNHRWIIRHAMDQLCLDPSLLLQYERSVVAVKGLEKPQQLVSYHVYNVNKYEYRTGLLFSKTLLKHMDNKAFF